MRQILSPLPQGARFAVYCTLGELIGGEGLLGIHSPASLSGSGPALMTLLVQDSASSMPSDTALSMMSMARVARVPAAACPRDLSASSAGRVARSRSCFR